MVPFSASPPDDAVGEVEVVPEITQKVHAEQAIVP